MEIRRWDTAICDVYLRDNSYTVEEVMGESTLTLNFLSRNVLDLQINDYIEFEGNTYKIRHNEKVTKRETSLGYEYNVVLYSSRYDLQDVQLFLHGTPERKKNFDYYTGTARDWLTLLVKNMSRADSGWVAGSCIESRMITLSFKDKTVGAVLDEVVKELDTEYWISGKTVNIGKREYSSNGLVLAQGEGMGFTELEVSAVDDTPPVTVLYPYGSDKNLGTDYGNDYLVLPGGVLSLEKNVDKYGRIERSVQFDHIFPHGEFTVTEKIDDLTLRASGIDFNLTDCLLDGVEVIVTFQDGGLAGYDLAIVEGSWDNTTKRFKLKVNEQENALKVPGDINFSVGDKFILTGLKMPQSYRDKASLRLQEESQAWLDSKCEKRIQLRGKCEEKTFRLRNIFIACGQMAGVYSGQLGIDREIRVTKVKRYLEKDGTPSFRYELTLSDFLESNGFKDLVDDVNKVPEEIEDHVRPVKEWSKRSWRDVMETLGMMFDPEGDYFTEMIKPLAVHTAQLIVGTNSQQLDLVGVRFMPNADNDPNYFKNTAGRLVHFTVSETGVMEWAIPAASFRLSNSRAYYVYAKCPREGMAGSILVSERQVKLEEEAGYYHFWVGVLNTPEDNVRSWNPNYGYTEIAGQTITTGVIKDKNANLVIDLANGTFTGPATFKAGSSGLDNVKEWPAAKKEIEAAQKTADDAVKEIGETKKALSGFEDTVNGAFKDGIIEEAEAQAIEKYINTLDTEKADADAVYNKLYANAYLTGTPKTDLLNSKITYNGAHTDLIKAVNDAISDGKTTATEKKNVDSRFTAYKNALADYKARVEAANKAIQDTLKGYSDTALQKGKEALTAAGNAQASADNAQESVTTLNTYVDGAFKDGIITKAEAQAIEKYLNTVKASKAEVEATYNKLYANAYLSGTAKSGLLNAKVTLFGAIDSLLSSINTAISDGKTTVAEKNDVDSRFTAFNNALSSFNTAVETANKAIQDTLKGYTDTVKAKLDSDLSIEAGRISAVSTRVDGIKNTIDTAGWINSTDGNLLYAGKKLESGNEIISYINQTATTTTIKANRIDLVGVVTFSMFSSGLKTSINNIESTANTAKSDASKALDDAASAWSKAVSAYEYAGRAETGASDAYQKAEAALTSATNAIDAAKEAQTSVGNLPGWSKEKDIIKALKDATVIVNGYIATSMIDTDSLYAKMANIGGFAIKSNRMESSVYTSAGNYLYTLYMDSGKGEIGLDGSSSVTYKLSGGYDYGDGSAALYIRKMLLSTKAEGPRQAIKIKAINTDQFASMIDLECESAGDKMTFLRCTHGIRSIDVGTKHFSNDSSGIFRTTIRLGLMPSVTQVNTESASGERYNVKWDSATGLLYIE